MMSDQDGFRGNEIAYLLMHARLEGINEEALGFCRWGTEVQKPSFFKIKTVFWLVGFLFI